MKTTAFLDIALCTLVVNRRFKGAFCLHHQGDGVESEVRNASIIRTIALMMATVRTSETSV
jgi:hypothetical protein